MTDPKDTAPTRRDFLKRAGIAAPAAVAAAAAGGTANATGAAVDPESQTMQDTDHTRAYLASARF